MSSLRQKIVPRGSTCELLALCLGRCCDKFVAGNIILAYRSSLLLGCGCCTWFDCRAPWLRDSSTRRLVLILVDETCSRIETKGRTVILSCKRWCILGSSCWIKRSGVSLGLLPWPCIVLSHINVRWTTHIVTLWGRGTVIIALRL